MRILYSLLSSLPLSFLYSISSFTSTVISTFYRKNVVLHNLNKSFPNEDDKKIIKIKNRFYQNFCDVFFETIKSYSIGKKELGSRVFFENFDVINNHILKNEKVVVFTSHQCNWEWLLLSSQLKLKKDLHVIYKKFSNKNFDKIIYDSRSRFGSVLIESKKAMLYLKNNLANIDVLAVVADQSPNKKNRKLWLKMLNQDTSFFESVEFIPKFTNSVVYFASMKRKSRGFYSVKFDLISKPPYNKKVYILPEYVNKIESLIKRRPSEWLWSHKRWKLKKDNINIDYE